MIHEHVGYKGDVPQPRHDIDPEYKRTNPKYSLLWAKYIYSSYLTGDTQFTTESTDHINKLRKYARGQQSVEKYKKHFMPKQRSHKPTTDIDDDSNRGKSTSDREWTSIDFDSIFSPMPKIVNAVQGIMESNEHQPVVNAIDEHTLSAKEYIKFSLMAESHFQEEYEALDQMMGIQKLGSKQPKPLPKSMEELQILEQMGSFKVPYETALEQIINHTIDISNNEKVKRRVVADLFTQGVSAVRTFYDKKTGKFKYKWIDVENTIVDRSDEEDFSDAAYQAYMDYYTISDLMDMTDMKEDEIRSIATKYAGKLGNPSDVEHNKLNDGTWSCGNYRVPVLHCFWKSTDVKYRKARKNRKGEIIYSGEPYTSVNKPPKVKNKKNRQIESTSLKTIYNCSWIVGSEKVFDYGRMTDIPYDYIERDAYMPIKFYRIPGKSPVENCIPVLDQIQYTYYRLQNAIIKAPPPGLKIEIGSLENISIGSKKMLPLDMIRLYSHTGNILYRLRPAMPNLPSNSGIPIEELKGGLGTAVTDAIQSLELFYRQIAEQTGIDQITTAGVSPTQEQGARVTEIAVAATSNVLKPIYTGYRTLKECVVKDVGLRVQHSINAVRDIRKSPYYDVVGNKLITLKFAGNRPPIKFGITVEAQPTEEMRQHVISAAQQALAGGKNGIPALRFSEYLYVVNMIKSGRNIRYVIEYIAYKERMNELVSGKKAEELAAAQAKEAQKQEAIKARSAAQKTALEGEEDRKLERVKGEEERKTAILEDQLENDDEARIK